MKLITRFTSKELPRFWIKEYKQFKEVSSKVWIRLTIRYSVKGKRMKQESIGDKENLASCLHGLMRFIADKHPEATCKLGSGEEVYLKKYLIEHGLD